MPDLSGSGLTLSSSGNNRPTHRSNAQNGLGVLETTPGQGVSVSRSFTPSVETAYFIVAKRTTAQNNNWIWQFPSNDINCLYSPSGDNWNLYNPGDSAAVTITSGWNLYSFGFTAYGQWPTKWARRNGGESSNSLSLGGNPQTPARTGFILGCRTLGVPGGSWTGQIGEFITTNRTTPDAEREKIEGYLAWKWGLESKLPSGHAYKGAAP